VLKGSKKNFSKVLDDAAKADQNLASLLLTTECKRKQYEAGKKAKSADENQQSIEKRNFQKYLTTKQKAD